MSSARTARDGRQRCGWTAALALAGAALSVPAPAFAATYVCPKSNYDVDLAVVYGNGMFTTAAQAAKQRDALRPLIAARLGHAPHAIAFDVAYNDDEEKLAQIWEVAKQRRVMTVSQFLRVLARALPAPDWLKEEAERIASGIDLVAFTADEDLLDHVQTYRDHLRKGRKVVVVGHSQGNLYANAAYRLLFEADARVPGERSFGLVAIATPAPVVAGSWPRACLPAGCYTTFAEDIVINAVRRVLPDTLPANVSGLLAGEAPHGDLLWHGLLESYLHIERSRERILDHVQAFVDGFDELEWTVHESMITVSLEWDSDADLDLHVYEHDDAEHVYYAYPAGAAGYLEADDEDGYGPENYYADCGYVQGGTYRFAVGYFAGEGPVTARVRVQAGDLTRTFVRVLPAPQGRASHTQPVTVGYLEVLDLGENEYDLQLFGDE